MIDVGPGYFIFLFLQICVSSGFLTVNDGCIVSLILNLIFLLN